MRKRNSVKIPSYRLHKASGRAVVTIAGRDYFLGRHGTPESREKYDRLIGEWTAAGRPRPWQGPSSGHRSGLSLAELMVAYLAHCDHHYRKRGEATSELSLVERALGFVKDLYARTPADEFTPLKLKAVREQMVEAGFVRKSVNAHVGRIKRMFKWGVENEMVAAATFQALTCVAGLKRGRTAATDNPPVVPVPEEHIEKALPHMPVPVQAMVRLQLLTGARPGEVFQMRACDINTSGDVWLFRPASHKTEHHHKERVIPIGPRAQEVIRPFLKPDLARPLFSPKESLEIRWKEQRRQRKSPVQPSQRCRKKKRPARRPNDTYSRFSYRAAIQRACKKADVPPWAPGRLRHNAATRVRAEFGVELAQVLLGHSSLDTTQIYAQASISKLERIAREIG